MPNNWNTWNDLPWRWYKTCARIAMSHKLLGKKSGPRRRSHSCSSFSEGLWSSFRVLIWKSCTRGWSRGNGNNWSKDDSWKGEIFKKWKVQVIFRETSSPSLIQLANSVHADQFHLNPAIDIRAHSIASSRRDKRDKRRAFLGVCQRAFEWNHHDLQEK